MGCIVMTRGEAQHCIHLMGGGVGDHVGTIVVRGAVVQHVEQRKPGCALIHGIFHRADVVLILFVDVVEGNVDVGLACEIVVLRKRDLNLAVAALIGLSNEKVAG